MVEVHKSLVNVLEKYYGGVVSLWHYETVYDNDTVLCLLSVKRDDTNLDTVVAVCNNYSYVFNWNGEKNREYYIPIASKTEVQTSLGGALARFYEVKQMLMDMAHS